MKRIMDGDFQMAQSDAGLYVIFRVAGQGHAAPLEGEGWDRAKHVTAISKWGKETGTALLGKIEFSTAIADTLERAERKAKNDEHWRFVHKDSFNF
jgi:hypothetical protein